jgi:hypothetical protein
MQAWLFAMSAAVVLAGCRSGDGLVVVTVDANPPLANVALLHTVSVAGGMTVLHDFTNVPPALGGGSTTTFGVQVPSSISGTIAVHVEADDAAGNLLAQGDGSTTLQAGGRREISVALGGDIGTVDMAGVDLGSSDLGNTCVVGQSTFGNCVLGP